MDKKEASGMKMYKVFYSFTLSPDKHFGVTRDKCKCGICPDKSIIKSGTEIYSHGDENEVDDETYIIDSLESAENYLEAKYEADNFFELDYIEEDENNPNGNSSSEFGDGAGDVQLDIDKVEVYLEDNNELLGTTEK